MKFILSFAAAAALLFSGCATNAYTGESQVGKTTIGAGIGAAVGAGVGALSSSKKDRTKGIITGLAAGAVVGGGVGAYMDYQNKKLADELKSTGVSVTKNADNTITLNMPGDITFASGKADINSDFNAVLNSVAKVFKEYDKTKISVTGYTDNTGKAATNKELSAQRAQNVANYLANQGVDSARFTTAGLGSSNPVASNANANGRAKNRRVVIKLTYVE